MQLPPSRHLPINASRAYNSFSKHAMLTGNSSSHFKVGFFHATGYGDVTPLDQKRALLSWTFGAEGTQGDGNGNKNAQMALGYRYLMGIGVNENCNTALTWYEAAAEQCKVHFCYMFCEINWHAAMAKFITGPVGGRTIPTPLLKLSDMVGGAYGYGSSAASTGHLANRAVIKSLVSKNAGEAIEDLMEYFEVALLSWCNIN